MEVRVGTSLLIVRNKRVLAGKRQGSHAANLYSFPGGHLDWNESWEDCVEREKNEECGEGLKIQLRKFSEYRPEFFVTNDIMPQYDKHYITIFMVADWVEGDPVNMEPHKCEGWDWYNFDELKKLCENQQCADWIQMGLIEAYRTEIGL